MTKSTLSLSPFNMFGLSNNTVGFDDAFKRLSELAESATKNIPNYPPYNIIKTGENTYELEMAVAGFGKHNLKVEIADGVLTVSGELSSESEDEGREFLHKGISTRAFKRSWTLADSVEIRDNYLGNGLLKIILERMIPENKKPKTIEINDSPTKDFPTEKQLLNEDDL